MKKMFRSEILTFTLLFAFVSPAFAGSNKSDSFTFIAMADSRGALTQINTNVLSRLATDANSRNPDCAFVIFAGDMISGSPLPPITSNALKDWQKIITSRLPVPIFPAVGNHEVSSKATEDAFRRFFANTIPLNGPPDELGLTYYFDHKNSRFIVLDTQYHSDPDRVRHLDWLGSVLHDARDKNLNHIFVVGHSPAFPVGSHLAEALPCAKEALKGNRRSLDETLKFWDLLKTYNVAAYICGHEHLYARQNIDGVWQILAGSAGAPLGKLNSPNANGKELKYYQVLGYRHKPNQTPQAGSDFVGKEMYHYVLFEVTPSSIKMQTFGFAKKSSPIELIDSLTISPHPAKNAQPHPKLTYSPVINDQ